MTTETSASFGAFRLDPQNACVWRGAEMIKLTPKAFAVLHYLVARPGRLVTKDELFTAVWPETAVSDIALSVCVRELRKNLDDDAKTPQYIETVHRRGFRFITAVTAAPVSSDKFRAPRQEEENQEPVLSGVEGEPGDSSLESSVQSLASENHHSSPQPVQTLNVRHQTLEDSAPSRFWSSRGLMLTILLLLSGGRKALSPRTGYGRACLRPRPSLTLPASPILRFFDSFFRGRNSRPVAQLPDVVQVSQFLGIRSDPSPGDDRQYWCPKMC